jgi:hypothetical protein
VARAAGDFAARSGQPAWVRWEARRLHRFDAATGQHCP